MKNKNFKIAVFNVFKHKRRTFFNAMTFAINMFALVLLLGMIRGQYNMMIDKTIDLQVGHLKIYKKGYVEEKKRMPLEINISNPDAVIADVMKLHHVKGAAKHIVTTGTLSSGSKKTGMKFYGIDMEKEKTVTTAFNKVSGTALSDGGGEILIGNKLSQLMSVEPGAMLMIYARTKDNANNLVDAEIKGVYTAGFEFMEKSIAVVPFDYASWFLSMDGAATEIKIALDDKKNTGLVKQGVQKILSEKYPDLIVRDWIEEAPEIIYAIQMDMVTYGIIFAILLFLAFFIIVNTLTISVFERTAEIGTLRAIGMQKDDIRKMFLTEGAVLGLIGVILGGLLVLPLVYYMNVHGIDIAATGVEDIGVPFEPVMKSINRPVDWLISGIICMISAALGAWFPAGNAAKTDIINALKRGVR
ncbi:MAG TPA: FtsX-like permease family protein [Candidatus Goldiibacteriota bacterium]|nr:FtsX-like permease family protein [Candidatus Goldiibacteriota bacterium]